MKKTLLRLATIGLSLGALFFSFSSGNSNHLIQSANAEELAWQLDKLPCPQGGVTYVCGPGSNPYCVGIPCN